jgi:hypothetical protein
MEEIEVPTEHLQEKIHEEVHGEGHHAAGPRDKWLGRVALSSALLAVLAAVSALLAGDHANEAMVNQIRASDQWNYYQAKGIKEAIAATKSEILKGLGKELPPEDKAKTEKYRADKERIKDDAEFREKKSENHLQHHVIFARAVTMFQVAIGIAAISVLTRKRRFWFVGLGFSLIGIIFLVQGLVFPGIAERETRTQDSTAQTNAPSE